MIILDMFTAHPFRAGRLSGFSVNCHATIWIQAISSGMEHVLEHLVTTAEADAVLEENVMAQRLLFQSAGTRPNGDFGRE